MMTQISEFSSHYYVIDADVVPYGGDEVVCDHNLYDGLCWYVDTPMVHMGGGHYYLHPEGAVPSDTIAVPSDVEAEGRDSVLVAKSEAAVELQ